jgi:[ribosomal protein S5]-alanine N-acetyltransferase
MDRLNFPEKIETERLLLRRLRYEDAEEIFYTYASKPEATRYMAWPTHQSVEDTRSFLRYAIHSWNQGTDYSFSIRLKDSEKLIGSFGLIHDHGKIQFGYILSPSAWGNGYATEACTRMMKMLQAFPSLFRIGTFVDSANTASIRVLLKSGLVEEARLEKWFRFVNQGNEPKDCLLLRLPLR